MTIRIPLSTGAKVRCIAALSLALTGSVYSGEIAPSGTPDQLAFFETNIRPVLAERCYSCHSNKAKKLKARLYLDSREGILSGGDNGAAIVPGKPDQSLLIEAIHYANVDLQMPPKDKLDDRIAADFEKWIAWGAPWPEGDERTKPAHGNEIEAFDLARRKAEHWAWQPVTNPPLPKINDNNWSRDPIDQFVLAKLREQHLTPSAATDKRTLIRRVTFDLIGLPPTPAEVDAFLKDTSERAYENLVDRLLDSPHFGERWARHWLDLVRYAETRGHEFDHPVPNAFRYRDYVIRAFNADIPYDQFVKEHIAGDLLPNPRLHPEEQFNESVIGTGFWFLGENIHSPVDIKQDEADRFDNMVGVASKSFLALTVACARCHDHKFDAISTKDYYAMFGFLQSSNYHQAPIDSMLPNKAIAKKLLERSGTAKRDIANAYSEALKPGIANAALYLQAVLNKETPTELDAELLNAWKEAVNAADDSATDLLRCVSPTHANKWIASEQSRAKKLQASWKSLDVIVDYASVADTEFIQDGGHGFGLAPVRPGSIRLDKDNSTPTAGPVSRIETYGAARRDALWSGLEIVDSERDPASKTTQQPGKMLRTPTFVLQAPGKLHYLVRGKGMAMAVVDSHRLVLGPLHGNVHRALNKQDELRWEEHPLQRYIGHNLHIEFVPEGDSPFEILVVAQALGDKVNLPKPDTFERPPLESLATSFSASAPTAMARVETFLSFLKASLEQWRNSTETNVALAPQHARAVDWMAQNLPLFVSSPANDLAPAQRIAKKFVEDQLRLTTERVKKSRTALAIMDGTAVDDVVYIRGSYKSPGEPAPRRFLEALGGSAHSVPPNGSGRMELARQITSPSNPFISRAIVNRIWHHLFGSGIVPTTDDFGVLGQRPSHPELLDHLAHSFIEDGWSIKRQIRRIVMTQTYQLASAATDPAAEEKDPQNKWLHRANVRRLQAEAIRDALLTVSGRLDTTPYGRSVPVHLTDFMTGRGRPKGSGPLDGNGRRSIYLEVRRNFLNPMMLTFDAPIPFNTMGRRSVSNVPSQALILMNDPFVIQQAEVWADRILENSNLTVEQRIDHMYQQAFARPASTDEIASGKEFLAHQAKEQNLEAASSEIWTDFAHVLFNTKEFIFLN